MHFDTTQTLGTHAHAHRTHMLPEPGADIQRQLHRFVQETNLPYDSAIGDRDPLLKHCILLYRSGLLVTATRAQAPLLAANCVSLASFTGLNVLLLRFCCRPCQVTHGFSTKACLISHQDDVRVTLSEGYRAVIPAGGGLLLRQGSRDFSHF